MKAAQIVLACGLVTLVASCAQKNPSDASIAETYIHKYGVEVAKDDWEARGKHGQIVSQRKDGVIVTRNYLHGQLDGESTFSFPHSEIISRIETYETGRLISSKQHYSNGNPMVETAYLPNGETRVTSWYQNGTPRFSEAFRNNLLLAGHYYNPANDLESQVKEGSGARIVRDEEGQLLSEDKIESGKMVARTTFFPNGDPESVTPYADGKVHGLKQTFLAGGIPHTIESWVAGELHGTVVSFVNGEKKSEIQYNHGRKHGAERRFGAKGEVVEEITWLHDRRHGADVFYIDQETKTDWYHHGQMVSKAVFDRLNPQATI